MSAIKETAATPETQPTRLTHDDLYHISKGLNLGLDPKIAELIRQEDPRSGWEILEPLPKLLDMEQIQQVGHRKIPCPMCGYIKQPVGNGDKLVWLKARGKVTGVEILKSHPCRCVYYELFSNIWDSVPVNYSHINLSTLQGDTPRFKAEPIVRANFLKLVRYAKTHPEDDYILLGPPGAGKSSVAFALMHNAAQVRAWKLFLDLERDGGSRPQSIWRMTADTLFAEHHAYTMGREIDNSDNAGVLTVPAPTLSSHTIKRAVDAGFRPFVILEEFEKVSNMSKFKLSVLHKVIDMLHANHGQLVIVSNLSKSSLQSLVGDSTWRRFTRESDPSRKTQVYISELLVSGKATMEPLLPEVGSEGRAKIPPNEAEEGSGDDAGAGKPPLPPLLGKEARKSRKQFGPMMFAPAKKIRTSQP